MDDGKPGSGSLRAGPVGGGKAPSEYDIKAEDVVVCVSLDGKRGDRPGRFMRNLSRVLRLYRPCQLK